MALFFGELMKKLTLIFALIISVGSMAFDGFKCEREDKKATLTAEFLTDEKAKIVETSEDGQLSYESSFKRFTLPHNENIAKTRFISEEYGILMVYETGMQILGVLHYPNDFPSVYNCSYLEL